MPAAILFIIVVTCIFAAICITQMIMKPVKQARSDKQWKQYREELKAGMR